MLCQALVFEVLVVLKAVVPPLAAGQEQGGSGCSVSSTSAAPGSASASERTGSTPDQGDTDALLMLLLASSSVVRAARPVFTNAEVPIELSSDKVSEIRTDAATCLHLTMVLMHRLTNGGDWWQAARTKHPLLLIVMLAAVLNVSAVPCKLSQCYLAILSHTQPYSAILSHTQPYSVAQQCSTCTLTA
jgi:hypothetical protein